MKKSFLKISLLLFAFTGCYHKENLNNFVDSIYEKYKNGKKFQKYCSTNTKEEICQDKQYRKIKFKNFVNACLSIYKNVKRIDETNGKDVWINPFTSGKLEGDCEDYVIGLTHLIKNGDNLYSIIGIVAGGNEFNGIKLTAHMWALFKSNGTWYIFDNNINMALCSKDFAPSQIIGAKISNEKIIYLPLFIIHNGKFVDVYQKNKVKLFIKTITKEFNLKEIE